MYNKPMPVFKKYFSIRCRQCCLF